jgi:hypothetical protein
MLFQLSYIVNFLPSFVSSVRVNSGAAVRLLAPAHGTVKNSTPGVAP